MYELARELGISYGDCKAYMAQAQRLGLVEPSTAGTRVGWRHVAVKPHVFGLVERQPMLCEVPTEFFEGEWHFPKADGPEPWAVITYTDEPSPETGDVGWCWWALGRMGDAPTYEEAKRKAETWVEARINGMPPSGRWA